MTQFYSSREAAEKLGVSITTLYAYVSRGKLQAQPGASHRERCYRIEEVEHLARQLAAGRSPTAATQRSLDFGRPVVRSSLCLIEGGQLYYRGRLATALAQTQSFEAIAALLWDCQEPAAFPDFAPSRAAMHRMRRAGESPKARELIASLSAKRCSPHRGTEGLSHDPLPGAGGALVRELAAAILRQPPSSERIHLQCARAWRLSRHHADLVRMALVLCADHELNASTFTVRCVASTQADLRAALIAGLAALSGPLHGGATDRVENLLDTASGSRRLRETLCAEMGASGRLPGFGHLLYPKGDIRAAMLLERLTGPATRSWKRIAAVAEDLTGEKPSVDFALVAVRRALRLPRGAAFGLFALGRSVGWVAHAAEQRRHGQLIRPRAEYTGPRALETT